MQCLRAYACLHRLQLLLCTKESETFRRCFGPIDFNTKRLCCAEHPGYIFLLDESLGDDQWQVGKEVEKPVELAKALKMWQAKGLNPSKVSRTNILDAKMKGSNPAKMFFPQNSEFLELFQVMSK